MCHVTDTLWNAYIPKLRNATILVMGTAEAITTKIHVDHMIDRLDFLPPLIKLIVLVSTALQNSALVLSDLNFDGTMTPSG